LDEKSTGSDWRTILLLIASLGGALLAFTSALGSLAFLFANQGSFSAVGTSPLAVVLVASGMTSVGLLLLPAGYYSLARLRSRRLEMVRFQPLPLWAWALLLLLWAGVLTLASLFHDAPGSLLYTPALHFFAVAIPLFILVRVAVKNIPLGSVLRGWGVFGSGLSLNLSVAVILETAVVVFFLLVFAVYLGLNPEKFNAMERFIDQAQRAPDLESILFFLGPVIKQPLTLAAALLFLSGIVPLIEEFSKSLSVWLVVDRLSSPAQGFALGVLSGAAFALVESLFASMNPDDAWAITFFARAFSGLMHALASGLAGLGIAYARLEKNYVRLAWLSALGILIHAAWNAGAVLTVAGSLRAMLAAPNLDAPGLFLGLAGMVLIFALAFVMLVGLVGLNARLQPAAPVQAPKDHGELERAGVQ